MKKLRLLSLSRARSVVVGYSCLFVVVMVLSESDELDFDRHSSDVICQITLSLIDPFCNSNSKRIKP